MLITGLEAGSGEDEAAAIRRESGQELVTFLQADHATVGGNRQLADQVRGAVTGLDVLFNTVGGLYQCSSRRAAGLVSIWPQQAMVAASPICSPEVSPGSEQVAS